MKTWVRKTLSVGVLAAGALLFAPGAAHADVSQDSWDNNGILNGAQFVAPINVPQNMVGNAIGVAGEANAAGSGVNESTKGGHVSQNTWHNNGIGNGWQAYFPVNVPVNVVGNSDAFLGHANAAGAGLNSGQTEGGHVNGHHGPSQDSWDNNGILNGTQIYAPVDMPINICGNSFALLGEANAQAVCTNTHYSAESAWSVSQDTSHNNGILNGLQVYAPVSLPVNMVGNSDAFLGHANAAGAGTNGEGHGTGFSQDSHDNNGIANGAQIAVPFDMPQNFCGNALGILGEANASAACLNGLGDLGGTGHGHGGDNGGQHGHGNGPGGDNGGANGGANGGDDGDYLGDHGSHGHGTGPGTGPDTGTGTGTGTGHDTGNGPANGGTTGSYGDGSGSGSAGGRSASEASPVDALTQGAGGVGLGGLDVLNTLR
jgi:hypothetical protein